MSPWIARIFVTFPAIFSRTGEQEILVTISPLEIFLPFLGCHQESLLDNLKWRWALGLEGELEMER